MEFLQTVLYFFIYAFLGWACEVIYCSIGKKALVNRGFLVGPICPIYGWGALLVLLPLYPLKDYWYLVLILGFLITSILEYFTSYIMEKMFHLSWWDYSHHKFNINGRVCLLNSTLFALLVMGMVYIVHPFIINIVAMISQTYLLTTVCILLVIYIVDTIYSFIAVGKLNELIEKFHDIKEDVEQNYDGEFSLYIYARIVKRFPKLSSTKHKDPFENLKSKILYKKKKLLKKKKNSDD